MPSVKGVLKGVFNQESGVTLRKDGLNALADFLADCPDTEQTAAQLFDAALQGALPGATALGRMCAPALCLACSGRVSAAGQRK